MKRGEKKEAIDREREKANREQKKSVVNLFHRVHEEVCEQEGIKGVTWYVDRRGCLKFHIDSVGKLDGEGER